MKRRDFIKLSILMGSAIYIPTYSYAKPLDVSKIQFSENSNNAQTIIIFLYGGASQLAGNLSNIDEIRKKSQSDYDSYFRGLTATKNLCWQEAGGDAMETLIANGDMTLFRCCYSQVREDNDNKAHGECTAQNQKGSFDDDHAGILANLAQILEENNIIDENTLMPFITMEGESKFYIEGSKPLASYLKPVGINENFNNPYKRSNTRRWSYYTEQERESAPRNYWKEDEEGGFSPVLNQKMDQLSQQMNESGKIKDAFGKREELSRFIDSIQESITPDLGDESYPDNDFSKKIEAAIKLLVKNPDTKVITLGTGGLGGWDDHNEARDYVDRMEKLFISLKSAMAHLKAEGKDQTINIMVFGEFGRNVNLNSAKGWDHGNLQNFYLLGGKSYFNHQGIVGETIVEDTGSVNRLYLKPKKGTYWFEPLSIAATLYKIYGIENPEELTGGYKEITPLFT